MGGAVQPWLFYLVLPAVLVACFQRLTWHRRQAGLKRITDLGIFFLMLAVGNLLFGALRELIWRPTPFNSFLFLLLTLILLFAVPAATYLIYRDARQTPLGRRLLVLGAAYFPLLAGLLFWLARRGASGS